MKYKAVIFDLFGTLILNFTVERHEGTLRQMAFILSAPSEDFVRLWYQTFNDRCLGILKTPEDNINYVCSKLGVTANAARRNEAALIRYHLTESSMIPVPGAIDTLTWLKSNGYKTGLVTDCSSEVPAIWPRTSLAPYFDITVFSCQVGLKKPDPQIYWLAAKQLNARPEYCLYIGDGSSNELSGATAVGMRSVLIRDPKEEDGSFHRVEAEWQEWDGLVISSLEEVLGLLE
jgi:putative hydrolase of the HAD superfamily